MMNDYSTEPIQFNNLLVLFGGAGLATRGLSLSGVARRIVSVEIDPAKHHLSQILNPDVEHVTADVMSLDSDWLAGFDAIWASPPCQERSAGNTSGNSNRSAHFDSLLDWSLSLPARTLWVENVVDWSGDNDWGVTYNAAQFEPEPRQNRQRVIGGRYRAPRLHRDYAPYYPQYDVCPAVTASEYKGCATDARRASRWYERRLSVREAAWHMGLPTIPHSLLQSWWYPLAGYTDSQWQRVLYEGIGNGVPIYMARVFGEAYSLGRVQRQRPLFDFVA